MKNAQLVLGIDVGATGIKGGLIDLQRGILVGEKIKYATPELKTPKEILKVVQKIISDFNCEGKDVGIGFPAVIEHGKSFSATNIDDSWIDFPIESFFAEKLGCKVRVVNDADAAGMAEMKYGIGKDKEGTIILLTLGTGIGSAIFKNGVLLENTEQGHLIFKDGRIAESFASNRARKLNGLSWEEFGEILNEYLNYVHKILNPDLIIIGGGISKKYDLYEPQIDCPCKVKAALQQNNAGIIGAALAMAENN